MSRIYIGAFWAVLAAPLGLLGFAESYDHGLIVTAAAMLAGFTFGYRASR